MADQQSEPNTARRERRDAQANRQQILAVAKRLFDSQGAAETSMREIALAAGVGQGTLYRHFADKGDLVHAMIRDDIEAFQQRIGELTAASAVSPLARLSIVIVERLRITESHLPLFPVMEESRRDTRRGEHSRSPFDEWTHALMVKLLEEASASGEIDPLDTAITANSILASVSPKLYRYQRQQCGYSIERINAALQRLFVDGLRRSPR